MVKRKQVKKTANKIIKKTANKAKKTKTRIKSKSDKPKKFKKVYARRSDLPAPPSFQDGFTPIDRNEENKSVLHFQKTDDEKVLENLYQKRIETLQIWANRYGYLDYSTEDMFAELTRVFIRAVHKYSNKKRKVEVNGKTEFRATSFNTYLFYCLHHHIKNRHNSKKAKKRTPLNGEKLVHLSLDYNYDQDGNSESTLQDIISKDLSIDESHLTSDIYLEETIDLLANDDNMSFKDFLVKLSEGNSLAALLREYKQREGNVKISRIQAKQLSSKRRCNRVVTNLIKDKTDIKEFVLVEYSVKSIRGSNKLHYTIELKKTEETDSILRRIRSLRKQKGHFMRKIRAMK